MHLDLEARHSILESMQCFEYVDTLSKSFWSNLMTQEAAM